MSAWKNREHDPRIERIASSMRVISNFPKPGFKFKDITTLLLDPMAFKNTVDLFVERYTGKNITVVAGVEARGFIFGPPIALAIGAKFVPLRKPRKLPGRINRTSSRPLEDCSIDEFAAQIPRELTQEEVMVSKMRK